MLSKAAIWHSRLHRRRIVSVISQERIIINHKNEVDEIRKKTVLNSEDRTKYRVLGNDSIFILVDRIAPKHHARKFTNSPRGNLINDRFTPRISMRDAWGCDAEDRFSCELFPPMMFPHRIRWEQMNREIRPRRKVNIDAARSRTAYDATFHSNRFSIILISSRTRHLQSAKSWSLFSTLFGDANSTLLKLFLKYCVQ